jgi:hypothetical protein
LSPTLEIVMPPRNDDLLARSIHSLSALLVFECFGRSSDRDAYQL